MATSSGEPRGNVTVDNDETCEKTFENLKLNDWILQQLKTVGISRPTPIQCHCIPQILKGRDCIGCAKTGSGKTLAFALPILQDLCEDPFGIFALVLTPTRELAFQIADQFRVLGKPIGLKDCVIVGGMDMMYQGQELSQSPHIVIATPGRLADHLQSCNTFNLKKIKYLVLDEADRLLEGPFNEQLKTIFQALPTSRRTLLFSATITDALEELQTLAMSRPYLYNTSDKVATVEQLKQHFVLTPKDVKDGYLVHIILKYREEFKKTSIVVFTKTCKSCQVMAMMLRALGFECAALHSMLSQRERLAALARFKSNVVRILIATDVASRGLDIPQVDLVMNHSVPPVPKDYIHRVGRTARAGRDGLAITLVTQHDIGLIHAIEDLINTKLTEYKVDEKEVLNLLTQVAMAKRESEIKLDEEDFDERRQINKRKAKILAGEDPDEDEKMQHFKKKRKGRKAAR